MELSILNVVPRRIGQSYKEAMDSMVRLAQKAEELGYARYWIAEHHNTKGFASSATALLIEHTLANTSKIRVGAGGVMLPNHSPYVVAEYYGTLETLYPDRVDLGLGRAPGTDQNTAMAIRRTNRSAINFPQEVQELQGYFEDTWNVHAYPAAGLDVPIYILGSSTDSAWLAAKLGLPYAFASHFAPGMMEEAVAIYRTNFEPSKYLAYPYVILGCNVVAANTHEEAQRLATTRTQGFADIIFGRAEGLKPPMKNDAEVWNSIAGEITASPHFGPVAFDPQLLIQDQKRAVEEMGRISLIGDKEEIKEQYLKLKEHVYFDELMVNTFIYDEAAQMESFQIFKEAVDEAENAE